MSTAGNSHFLPERGAATLAVATLLLAAASLLAVVIARPMAAELRLAGGEMRDQQAFQAAQAAVDRAIATLDAATGFDTAALDAEGAAANGPWRAAFCAPEASPESLQCAAAGAPAFTGACTPPGANAISVWVVGCGWSDDRTSRRRIVAQAAAIDPLPGGVSNPLTTPRGVAFSAGNSTVTNYHANLTIWSGQPVTQGAAGNGKTVIRRPTRPANALTGDEVVAQVGNGDRVCSATQAPDLLCTTSAGVFGPDVVQADPSLLRLSADEFVTNFLGLSLTEYKSAVADRVVPASEASALAGAGLVTVVEGAVSWGGNTSLGTASAPAIVVVDGDVSVSGGPTFVGVLVIRGSLSVSGSMVVRGAVLASGPVSANGTLNVIYDPQVTALARRLGRHGVVPGSWRDF